MFNFIKKGTATDKDDKKKRDKKERKEKKRDRTDLTADEILRLDEVRKSLRIGRKKEKEKLPSGITADYTADFLASLERDDKNSYSIESPHHEYLLSDSSENSLNSLNQPNRPPVLPPKPPKRGILKTPKNVNKDNESVKDETDLALNTLRNEVISYNNGVTVNGKNFDQLLVVTSASPSGDSLSDTTNSSFATPPFSLSPVGESQGFHRWSRTGTYEDLRLPLPKVVPLILPASRLLTVQRQKPPRHDFGFSLRRAMVLERSLAGGAVSMRAAIFAEPGATVQHVNETGLLPGDRLLAVNGARVDGLSREEIVDMIKASDDVVTLKVQPVAELSELSRRSCHNGDEHVLDDSNIHGGTLKRSGSRRFKNGTTAKSEEHLEKEKQWLESEKVWLMHRGGFTLATKVQETEPGKVKIKIEATGDELTVDEDDIEPANPPQFARVEDVTHLRYLNESSLLNTLRQRFAYNLVHTYASNETLLVVNPMAPLAIYSEKVVALFRGCKSEDMPPHIYAVAQSAYRAMLSSRRDQGVVYLGRSGAGKTTNFRHSVQYLVTAAGAANRALTVDRLIALWTALENFGNCRTATNANATRFAQTFSVDFDQSGAVASASIQTMLLERSRIVAKRSDGESTFHVMQRMLCGLEGRLRKELYLDGATAEPNAYFEAPHKHEDKQRQHGEFTKLCAAFGILGVTEAEQKVIFSVLAAIYHLGFAGSVKAPSGGRYQFANPQAAQRAAHLLGTSTEELSRTIFGTSSGTATPSQPRAPFRTPSPVERGFESGADAVEGFMAGLYGELFNAVVFLLNRSISTPAHTANSVLLVDVPGFQNGATCGRQSGATLEDLCYNYLQERLQLLYHHTNLVSMRDRYAQERVQVEGIGDVINPAPLVALLDRASQGVLRTSCADLRDADRRGLLWLLDEDATCPGSTDESFVERLFTHYGDRDHQLLMMKAPCTNQFILQHLQGTNPVLYTVKGWLKASRENPVSRLAAAVLLESSKDEVSKLFVNVRGLSSSLYGGSFVGLDGTQSLKRGSSIRRTFTNSNAAIKRKSVCLQTKFMIDGLVETLRRTKLRFVQCLLPTHDAAVNEFGTNLLGGNRPDLINVPLLRSQIRGAQILDAARLFKRGYPSFVPLGEFRRRFRLLDGDSKAAGPVLDERKAVEDLLATLDLEATSYRIGLSLVFFRNGVLSQLESQRDECLGDVVVRLQARCRGHLARRRLAHRQLQDVAARCIQKNVRKFLLVRDWPWWRLLVRVTPLLNVHRTEEKLKIKTEEFEALRLKLEKSEHERNQLKHDNDKLEAKLSEMTADLSEEHSAATLASERLEAESAERLRLERELNDAHAKNRALHGASERLEMELLYARADMNGDVDDDGGDDGADAYRQRYERAARELEFTKRRLRQQHEDDLEQLVGLKKQLEKKLADAYEEAEEQRQVVGQWKCKVQKLNGEMNDLKLLLEEQSGRNNLLEKKQRRFDSETQLLHDELKKEKNAKERALREKELAMSEKYAIETSLADARLNLELKEEKLKALQREFDELVSGERTEEEATLLRRQKIELERRLHDQEEELDELASSLQLLEQAKLRLEMTVESMRKEAKKEANARDEEIEEIRCNAQKKVKALEQQLENEHEERTQLLRQKHELERRLASLADSERQDREGDEALIRKLKSDLRKTKALLRDAQTQLEQQKEGPSRHVIRQLKNQLDDAESARAIAVKSKQGLELELSETQTTLEDVQRARREAEERASTLAREKGDLHSQLEENEEELAEVLKKYKASIQQMALDQGALQEQITLVSDLETERNQLKEQLAELSSRLENAELIGDQSSSILARRNEFKLKELESKLDLEQTTRTRLEVQISRLKETVEKLQSEVANSKAKEQLAQDEIKKLQRLIRELKEELNTSLMKESEAVQKKRELEKRLEGLEAEMASERTDLKLARKRIEDLQSALQGEFNDSVSDHSECDQDDSDCDSVTAYLANHREAPSGSRRVSSSISRSSTSSNLGKDSSYA